ncbi:helix-turn-helix transcriptional regulator [Kitasatospora sp. GP30]|uniref:helix-turn-helix domain-containing protein n=1 Tax=Kitasatospora sp. GP30 TaxID=3035084 RepID=UPI00117FCFC4|nr:helix-turn-helix transcriptional regulator [Kitasatospora sp. GP30]
MREDLAHLIRLLSAPTPTQDGQAQELLRTAMRIEARAPALMAGTVGHARRRRITWSGIGTVLGIVEHTARRRYRPEYIERRVRTFTRAGASRERNERIDPPGQLFAAPGLLSPHPVGTRLQDPSTAPALPSPPLPAAASRPALNRLATELSMMVRATGISQCQVASLAGISASYLCKVLQGRALPTWETTASIVRACDADPALVRVLWERERLREYDRGPAPASPGPGNDLKAGDALRALRAGIATLHLRACHPSAEQIAVLAYGRLTPEEVIAISRDECPDWEQLTHLISALGGDSAFFRPLWEAATRAHPPSYRHVASRRAAPLPFNGSPAVDAVA